MEVPIADCSSGLLLPMRSHRYPVCTRAIDDTLHDSNRSFFPLPLQKRVTQPRQPFPFLCMPPPALAVGMYPCTITTHLSICFYPFSFPPTMR